MFDERWWFIRNEADREAALQAIHDYDVAHGRIVPLPGYDHVHRVTPDEDGTGDARL